MQRWRRMLTFMVCDTATNSKDQKTGGVRSEFLEATSFSLTWFTELSWMDAIPRSRGILFVSVILLDLTIIFHGLNFYSENYYYYWGCTRNHVHVNPFRGWLHFEWRGFLIHMNTLGIITTYPHSYLYVFLLYYSQLPHQAINIRILTSLHKKSFAFVFTGTLIQFNWIDYVHLFLSHHWPHTLYRLINYTLL